MVNSDDDWEGAGVVVSATAMAFASSGITGFGRFCPDPSGWLLACSGRAVPDVVQAKGKGSKSKITRNLMDYFSAKLGNAAQSGRRGMLSVSKLFLVKNQFDN